VTTALAKRTLQKGDFVVLYEGTLTRKPTEWARNMTFGVGDYYVVGNGCAASQILHSCSPNTVAQVWIDRGDCGTLDRRCIAVFVCKKVDKGRPLGLNYGWLPSNAVATGIPCRCAALRGVCSGYVGVDRASLLLYYGELAGGDADARAKAASIAAFQLLESSMRPAYSRSIFVQKQDTEKISSDRGECNEAPGVIGTAKRESLRRNFRAETSGCGRRESRWARHGLRWPRADQIRLLCTQIAHSAGGALSTAHASCGAQPRLGVGSD